MPPKSYEAQIHDVFEGSELERAYAELFDVESNGGFNDHGLDIIPNLPGVPPFQVKNSWEHAEKFIAIGYTRGEFIPIVIGDPGTHSQFEIGQALAEDGYWVSEMLPDRAKIIEKIEKRKKAILALQGGHVRTEV